MSKKLIFMEAEKSREAKVDEEGTGSHGKKHILAKTSLLDIYCYRCDSRYEWTRTQFQAHKLMHSDCWEIPYEMESVI